MAGLGRTPRRLHSHGHGARALLIVTCVWVPPRARTHHVESYEEWPATSTAASPTKDAGEAPFSVPANTTHTWFLGEAERLAELPGVTYACADSRVCKGK